MPSEPSRPVHSISAKGKFRDTDPTPPCCLLPWFITGFNRGTGTEIADAALAAGNRGVTAGRKPEAVTRALGIPENILVAALEVSHEDPTRPAGILGSWS
jgi:hypothetical protein